MRASQHPNISATSYKKHLGHYNQTIGTFSANDLELCKQSSQRRQNANTYCHQNSGYPLWAGNIGDHQLQKRGSSLGDLSHSPGSWTSATENNHYYTWDGSPNVSTYRKFYRKYIKFWTHSFQVKQHSYKKGEEGNVHKGRLSLLTQDFIQWSGDLNDIRWQEIVFHPAIPFFTIISFFIVLIALEFNVENTCSEYIYIYIYSEYIW